MSVREAAQRLLNAVENMGTITSQEWNEARSGLRAALADDEDARDAARWREVLQHVGGASCRDGQMFVLRYLRPASNLMKGSVAQHFTEAIDAAMQEPKNGS